MTLNASADAWIDQNSPSNNFGADSILKVQAKKSNNFRTFVSFALPATPPSGCIVQSATLKLYAASWKNGRTLQALRAASAWSENALSWNNQPATIGAAATTNSGSGWRQWNVTAQVQAMFDTSANHGFLLRDATENGGGIEQQFHGREKNDKIPQLVITYGTPAARSAIEADPNVETWVDSDEQGIEIYLPLIQQGGNQAIELQPVELQKGQSEVSDEVVEPVSAIYLPIMQSTRTSVPILVDEERKVEEPVEVEAPTKIHLPMIVR